MNILSRNKVLAAGVGLILLTNIIVISGAWYNRSGEPDTLIELTERELALREWDLEENSGLSLHLTWTVRYYSYESQFLLGPEKLKELGYDLIDSDDPDAIEQYVRKQLPRPAWVVLEFDGDTYRKALQAAEEKYQEDKRLYSLDTTSDALKNGMQQSKRELSLIRYSASRLYVVDAGPDPEQLRQQYTDKSHYIVTSGIVKLDYNYVGTEIRGYVTEISVNNIHVPLDQRAVFDSLPVQVYSEEGYFNPRYRVQLAYGKRYEPWIVKVEPIVN